VSWSYRVLASSMLHAWNVTCKQLHPIPVTKQGNNLNLGLLLNCPNVAISTVLLKTLYNFTPCYLNDTGS